VRDVVPPLAGLRDHYGTSVYVCPLCDGYECREQRVVILGAGGSVGAFAQELLQWASSVVVVPLGDERPTDALPDGVTCTDHPATAVHGSSCVERVELKDGSIVPCDAIFFRSETIPATDMAADVGCDLDEDGLVIVDADGRASAPDVYAAGDCTPGPRIVQVAAAEGARAGLQCAETLMARR
jgi:thioredoxin reductase